MDEEQTIYRRYKAKGSYMHFLNMDKCALSGSKNLQWQFYSTYSHFTRGLAKMSVTNLQTLKQSVAYCIYCIMTHQFICITLQLYPYAHQNTMHWICTNHYCTYKPCRRITSNDLDCVSCSN